MVDLIFVKVDSHHYFMLLHLCKLGWRQPVPSPIPQRLPLLWRICWQSISLGDPSCRPRRVPTQLEPNPATVGVPWTHLWPRGIATRTGQIQASGQWFSSDHAGYPQGQSSAVSPQQNWPASISADPTRPAGKMSEGSEWVPRSECIKIHDNTM
jgi:hypothetical protein